MRFVMRDHELQQNKNFAWPDERKSCKVLSHSSVRHEVCCMFRKWGLDA